MLRSSAKLLGVPRLGCSNCCRINLKCCAIPFEIDNDAKMKWATVADAVRPELWFNLSEDPSKALEVFLLVRQDFLSHPDVLWLWPAVFLRGVVWCHAVCRYQLFPVAWPEISLMDLLPKKKTQKTQKTEIYFWTFKSRKSKGLRQMDLAHKVKIVLFWQSRSSVYFCLNASVTTFEQVLSESFSCGS